MSDTETYPGGFDALMHRVQVRREALHYAEGEALPSLEDDLTPLRGTPTILEPVQSGSTFESKKRSLQDEFEGHSELCCLNGLVIANLRKDRFPEHTPALFQKIWAEHADFLIERLPLRWLVSTMITFGDHGVNAAQQSLGRSLTVLFSMIKLYEFERLYSGYRPDVPYSTQSKVNSKLPLGMPSYSLKGGGLDVALLTRLWSDCDEDPVIAPLARHLLCAINEDPGTLFRRLRDMADERLEHLERNNSNPIPVAPRLAKSDPDSIEWAVVATANENVDQTEAFAAHHLDLGADAIYVFVEDDQHISSGLSAHPQIKLLDGRTLLDPENLPAAKRQRNARKAHYFNWARRKSSYDWLAMLDMDEYLMCDEDVPEVLARTPKEDAFIHLPVFEYFAESDGLYRPAAAHSGLSDRQVAALYPVFGAYAADLILGQADPRLMLRARVPDIRAGNFVIKYNGKSATNAHQRPDFWVAHRHCNDYADFIAQLPRRIDQGYARRHSNGNTIRSVLEVMQEGQTEDEMQSFFAEIATARPEIVAALTETGALRHVDLNIAEKIAQMRAEQEE